MDTQTMDMGIEYYRNGWLLNADAWDFLKTFQYFSILLHDMEMAMAMVNGCMMKTYARYS